MAGPQKIANEPYETDFHKLGGGLSAPYRAIAGLTGNALTRAGLTNPEIQARDLATRETAGRQPRGITPPPIAGSVPPVSRGTSPVSSPRLATTPPRAAAAGPITGPNEPSTRYENMDLGPNDLSRTSTGRVLAPVKPVGIADGTDTGYAIVGGKRVNYRDIGTKRDPLYSRRADGIVTTPEGSSMLLGNARGYQSSPPGSRGPGIAGAPDAIGAQQQQVDRNAQSIGAIMQGLGSSTNGFADISRIAGIQAQSDSLNQDITRRQHGIDQDKALAMNKYGIDAGLAGHMLAAEGRERTAQAEAAREQQKQQAAEKLDGQKRRDGLVRSYLDRYDWGKISPTAANEYAGLLADTDGKGYVTVRDPSGTHGDILIHQNIEGPLRDAYRKIRTPEQFQAYLNQAQKLGAGQAPIYQTKIRNTANLSLIRSRQGQLPEVVNNG